MLTVKFARHLVCRASLERGGAFRLLSGNVSIDRWHNLQGTLGFPYHLLFPRLCSKCRPESTWVIWATMLLNVNSNVNSSTSGLFVMSGSPEIHQALLLLFSKTGAMLKTQPVTSMESSCAEIGFVSNWLEVLLVVEEQLDWD